MRTTGRRSSEVDQDDAEREERRERAVGAPADRAEHDEHGATMRPRLAMSMTMLALQGVATVSTACPPRPAAMRGRVVGVAPRMTRPARPKPERERAGSSRPPTKSTTRSPRPAKSTGDSDQFERERDGVAEALVQLALARTAKRPARLALVLSAGPALVAFDPLTTLYLGSLRLVPQQIMVSSL